jgi:hypothetical protein
MLDREGVQRILLAVNLPLVPASDPDKLLADLEGCRSIYRTGVALRERSADREELARRILAAFEKGNALLDKYIRTYGALYLRPYRMRLDGLRRTWRTVPG